MINKATALEPLHQQITWGAGQLGIAQGVLKALTVAARGRDPEAARTLVDRRDSLQSPFYGGD
jgi:hypothetical protein